VDGGIVINCDGVSNVDNDAAGTAKTDLGYAYTQAADLTSTHTITAASDIGGQTLYPGIYADSGNLNIGSSVTLDGQESPCALFVFQVAGNLNATVASVQVSLINGATAANVYWQVAGVSALGASVTFAGNIMDYSSITFGTGAVLQGRALAENGEVTLLGNTITLP
jgi:type VI secretion system secreted protein VgrG